MRATIGNYQEAYATSVWGNNYTPYGQSIADRMYPGDTYTEREMMMNNLSLDYTRRIEDLERKVRELNERIMSLEGALWGNYNNILERLNELEKSAGFSYVKLENDR